MSKVSFRARQIDFNKPLPIIRHESEFLAEISENALVSRGVPSIPSGMEKEEENEHHFVEVIQALQNKNTIDAYIPVPDIKEDQQRYYGLYPKGFVLPHQFIHIRTAVFADDEPVEYDMDSEDEKWLKDSGLKITSDKFEAMIDKLERGCGQKVMNLEEAKYLLQDDQSLAIAIYDYWLTKRVQCRQPLLLSVKQEKRDGSNNNNSDPYVAFRRRTERMQTRKNRKNDENSYEKMLLLREQMDALDEILSSIVKRESTKESLIANERDLFLLRCKIGDYDGSAITEAEASVSKFAHPGGPSIKSNRPAVESPKKRSAKKRRGTWNKDETFHSKASSSEELSDDDPSSPDNEFAFIRLPGVRYQRPLGRLTSISSVNQYLHPSMRYSLATVPNIEHPCRHLYTGYVRRRIGRGGRVICDRIPASQAKIDHSYLSAYDSELSCYDHNDFSNLVRPIDQDMLSYESRFEAIERIKASFPLSRLELQSDESTWMLRPYSPELPSSPTQQSPVSPERCPAKRVNLKRSKFDDRPDEDATKLPDNHLTISSLNSNNLVRRTLAVASSGNRLLNGSSTPRMTPNGKPVNGCGVRTLTPLSTRLLNGVSQTSQKQSGPVTAKKMSQHPNGTSGTSNSGSSVFCHPPSSPGSAANTARAC